MDIIVEKYFNKFLKEYSISGKDISENFEKFINHCVLSTQNITNFNLESVHTGSGEDCGTDGIAISVNNRFVSSLTEITDIINYNMEIEVKFFFIQTKMTSSFDGSEILTFGNGVLDIFRKDGENTYKRNEKVKEKCKIIQVILDNFEILKEEPKCYLYYVTTGIWVDDQNLGADVKKVTDDLKGLEFFKEVCVNTCDKNDIRKLYELSKNQNVAEFTLSNKIEIPYIEGIKESYIALMQVKELIQLISDGDMFKKGIFDSNVRDFQGLVDNRVNYDINETINSKNNNRFGLLNNGITIVGKSLHRGKGKFIIKNFQVVNGCQTSNILFENKDNLNDEMWVSVKIIITESDEIINSIVKATNNQTEVDEVQLQAMTEYQYILESFYNTYSFEGEELYYERRLGQYNSRVDIEQSRVISFEEQIKSFSAVFLNIPHRSSRFYKTILEEIEKKIFIIGQNSIIYFTSAYLSYKIDNVFNNNKLDNKYKKFKYHIIMLMRLIICKDKKVPNFNSDKIIPYCEEILKQVKDNFDDILEEVLKEINIVIRDLENQDNNKLNRVVNQLIMFNELNITQENIQKFKSFVHEVDVYITPFENIKDDGDMRYNMEKWIQDLIGLLNKNGFEDIEQEIQELLVNLEISSRECRKEVAEIVYNKIRELESYCRKQIDLSKKYILND